MCEDLYIKVKEIFKVATTIEAYDRMSRDIIWQDIYDGTVTTISSPIGETSEFPIAVWLNQGSALSPHLFSLVMDKLSIHIQNEVSWCMLYDRYLQSCKENLFQKLVTCFVGVLIVCIFL